MLHQITYLDKMFERTYVNLFPEKLLSVIKSTKILQAYKARSVSIGQFYRVAESFTSKIPRCFVSSLPVGMGT